MKQLQHLGFYKAMLPCKWPVLLLTLLVCHNRPPCYNMKLQSSVTAQDIKYACRICGMVENKVSSRHEHKPEFFCDHVCNNKKDMLFGWRNPCAQVWVYVFSEAIRITGIMDSLPFWISSWFMKPVKL